MKLRHDIEAYLPAKADNLAVSKLWFDSPESSQNRDDYILSDTGVVILEDSSYCLIDCRTALAKTIDLHILGDA